MFLNQKFVGGIDVVTELLEEDEFDSMVPQQCKALSPEESVKKILAESKVLLLIKGSLESPQDENSKAMIAKIHALKCEFTAIDVV